MDFSGIPNRPLYEPTRFVSRTSAHRLRFSAPPEFNGNFRPRLRLPTSLPSPCQPMPGQVGQPVQPFSILRSPGNQFMQTNIHGAVMPISMAPNSSVAQFNTPNPFNPNDLSLPAQYRCRFPEANFSRTNLNPILLHYPSSNIPEERFTRPVIPGTVQMGRPGAQASFIGSDVNESKRMVRQDNLETINSENDDKTWVKHFCESHRKIKRLDNKKDLTQLKIHDYQAMLREALQVSRDFKTALDEANTSNHGDERHQLTQISSIANRLKNLMEYVNDEERLKTVERLVERRRKKQARLKRRRRRRYQESQLLLEARAVKHRTIDAALEAKALALRNQKQEKELRAHADAVQAEVSKKLTESEKMIELLKSIRKLRKVRLHSVVSRGINANMSLHEAFETKISSLLNFVQSQKAVYEYEKKTLEVMLEHEHAETKDKERDAILIRDREIVDKHVRRIEEQLFGKPEACGADMMPFRQYYTQAETSLNSLLTIRSNWDAFLVPPHVPGASRIPDSWLEPETPSSKEWAAVLKE